MVTPLGWLERVPTYKEALENVKDKDLHTYGFLGYPCLQTADIVIYSKEGTQLVVPVGEDQVSHVELSREIVRRFDNFYGWKVFRQKLLDAPVKSPDWQAASTLCGYLGNYNPPEPKWGQERVSKEVVDYIEASLPKVGVQVGAENLLKANTLWKNVIAFVPVLIEPDVMLTQTPRIPGLDGRKMSKSYGNTITLSESDADIRAKTKVMVTDPARKRRTDPGNPDVCPVYDWHKLFSPPETLKWSAEGCRTAGIGCIECKAAMADNLIKWIAPIRERRVEYEKNPKRVLELIDDGSQRARVEAVKTMTRVREAVFGWGKKRKEISGGGTAANA
jgi:tryptophanyl-tRNA synthetase